MQETELKLSLVSTDTRFLEQVLDRLAQRVTSTTLRNIYFDTPDHALHRNRIALRIRQMPQQDKVQWIQTLKMGGGSDSALSQRGEWEAELPDDKLSQVLLQTTPWAQWDASGVIFSSLDPCFTTVFQRTTWIYESPNARIEVALDLGEIVAGDKRCPIAELECELQAGNPVALFELAAQLAAQVALVPAILSKAQRGFALALNTIHIARKRKDYRSEPAHQRVTKVHQDAFAQFSTNLNTMLNSPSETLLHQTLIGFRRLLAAQKILQKKFSIHTPCLLLWSRAAKSLHESLRNQMKQATHTMMLQTLHQPLAGLELLQTSKWLALEHSQHEKVGLVELNK